MHYCVTKLLATVTAAAITLLPAAPAFADGSSTKTLTHVPSANSKRPGFAAPNILAPGLTEVLVATGSSKLENPSDLTSYYGYDNDGPMLSAAGDLPSLPHKAEAGRPEAAKKSNLV